MTRHAASSGSSRQGSNGRAMPAGGLPLLRGAMAAAFPSSSCSSPNSCRFDCAYCMNRASNDIVRTSFTTEELVSLTVSFYKRNYIEGLFLSSGIFADPDIVMERLIGGGPGPARRSRIRRLYPPEGHPRMWRRPSQDGRALRGPALGQHRAAHPPGASRPWPRTSRAGRYLAPCATSARAVPRGARRQEALPGHSILSRRRGRAPSSSSAPRMTADRSILGLAQGLYGHYGLRRVYYSAYLPGAPGWPPPPRALLPSSVSTGCTRADWLLRFYGFKAEEILEATGDNLAGGPRSQVLLGPLPIPGSSPSSSRGASQAELLRVPGALGATSARRIVECRRASRIRAEDLGRLGLVMKRARYFISLYGRRPAEIPDILDLRACLADRPAFPGTAGPGPVPEHGSRVPSLPALGPVRIRVPMSEVTWAYDGSLEALMILVATCIEEGRFPDSVSIPGECRNLFEAEPSLAVLAPRSRSFRRRGRKRSLGLSRRLYGAVLRGLDVGRGRRGRSPLGSCRLRGQGRACPGRLYEARPVPPCRFRAAGLQGNQPSRGLSRALCPPRRWTFRRMARTALYNVLPALAPCFLGRFGVAPLPGRPETGLWPAFGSHATGPVRRAGTRGPELLALSVGGGKGRGSRPLAFLFPDRGKTGPRHNPALQRQLMPVPLLEIPHRAAGLKPWQLVIGYCLPFCSLR